MKDEAPPAGANGQEELDALLASLPFRIFVWIAEAISAIETGEVEIFLNMLGRPRWCRSAGARELMTQAAGAYTAHWKAYQGGELIRELYPVQEAVQALQRGLAPDEAKLLVRDLDYLAQAIARSSSRFLGIGYIRREQQRALNQLSVALDGQLVLGGPGGAESAEAVPLEGPEAPPHASYMPLAVVKPEHLSRWEKGKLLVRCVEIVDVTHDARTFRFVSDPPTLFHYKPGQFLTLELEIDGKPTHRSYTISSTPSRPHALEITVKRVAGGRVSNWLHDNLRVGATLSVKGPSGRFNCFDHPARKMLLISGGAGITPVMSMARWVLDTAADCDLVFLHAARTPEDIIFRTELGMMEQRHRNFRLFLTVSRPPAGGGWEGFSGRISPELFRRVAADYRERSAFVCGPTGFMDATRHIMEGLEFPMEHYYEESFGEAAAGAGKAAPRVGAPGTVLGLIPRPDPTSRMKRLVGDLVLDEAAAAPRTAPAAPEQMVVFAQSGLEGASDGETTILDLAEELGVPIPSACRSGVCGTCKVKKMEGDVEEDEQADGLEPDEIEAGYILTCVSRPKGRVVLDT